QQPLFVLFAVLGPAAAAAHRWSEHRRLGRLAAQSRREYDVRLRTARLEVQDAWDEEDERLRSLWPDVETVVRIATAPRVELWQRRPEHPDWSNLRLGTADRPAAVLVTGPRPSGWVEPVVPAAPVGLRLDDCPVLGLAGPPEAVLDTLRWVLLQAAALHSPTDLRIVVLAPRAAEADLGWSRWLPHARDDDGNVLAAWTDEEVTGIVTFLRGLVDARATATGATTPTHRPLPRILVVLQGAAALRRDPVVGQLLADGPAFGLAFVCTEPDPDQLPHECGAVLTHPCAPAAPTGAVPSEGPADVPLGAGLRVAAFPPARPPATAFSSAPVPAGRFPMATLTIADGVPTSLRPDRLERDAAQAAARALAPLRTVGGSAVTRLPDQLRYVELAGLPDADQVAENWRRRPTDTVLPIGADADGPVTVDLVRDGPHALVVGSGGAGRTELLQTLVSALAARNTPAELNLMFVAADNGATFRDLRRLPHVVATVTGLDRPTAARMLASLRGEVDRRRQQLTTAGQPDINGYLRLRADDPGRPPLPRLVVVVDEFAPFQRQLPDLLDELVDLAAVGGSLGLHLVLATREPGVVARKIRDNAGLRICLRIDDDNHSVDIIGVPDAARIPRDRPGRAYLCRTGQPPRLIQIAQITTPRAGSETTRQVVPLRWYDGVVPTPPWAPHGATTDLAAVLETVGSAARTERMSAPRPILLPPLPDVVTLDNLPAASTESGPAHRHLLILGLRDLPAEQRQEPLVVALGSGHLAIVGAARSGRTSAVRAVAVGLAELCTPDEVHLHVLDGAGALTGLAALPHCGVRCWPEDGERVDRLLNRLTDLLAERRTLLAGSGVASVTELWERDPAQAPPQVVLLIDGWEAFGEPDGGPRQDRLEELMAHGLPAGITVCLAGDERLLSSPLLRRTAHRLLLRLDNATDAVLAGLPPRAMPAYLPVGRALWAVDGTEVQLPLLAADPSAAAQTGALAAVTDRLRTTCPVRSGTAGAPMRLDPLPRRITVEEAGRLGSPPGPGPYALLGVTGDRLAPLWIDPRRHRSIVVAGPPGSGRSTAAAAIAVSLARQGSRALLVAAAGPGGVHRWAGDHGVTVVTAAGVVDTLATATFDVVLVDDADRLSADDPALAVATTVAGVALVVTATLDAFGGGMPGPLPALRRAATAVVLLSPPDRFSAAGLGVQISHAMAFNGPPGRAYLVVDGVPALGQVATVEPAAGG
ncbi:MAG TPA: FtsK/SpoIIIE domain-containing protein, partial [Catenuloplanes sp.]